jgi:osmoprotectant transport system permease protein
VPVGRAAVDTSCLAENAWICPAYWQTRSTELTDAVLEHLGITVAAIVIGVLVAFPLALVARRWGGMRAFVLGASTALYTIPSLALFSILLPFTGLTVTTVVVGLVLYSLTILVRTMLAGLDAVPGDAREAAVGMGFGPGRLLWSVELPLALPSIFAGLRVATVSTIALTTIGSIVGYGGLGNLIYEGLRSLFKAQVLTASVLCVVLALAADVLLLAVQRRVTPWQRSA